MSRVVGTSQLLACQTPNQTRRNPRGNLNRSHQFFHHSSSNPPFKFIADTILDSLASMSSGGTVPSESSSSTSSGYQKRLLSRGCATRIDCCGSPEKPLPVMRELGGIARMLPNETRNVIGCTQTFPFFRPRRDSAS